MFELAWSKLLEFWGGFLTHASALLPPTNSIAAGISFALIAAVILVPIMSRVGLGTMIGYLLAGIVVGPYGLGLVEGGLVADLGVKLELSHAGAVAKVDKDQAAVVAAVPDPAGERDLLADVDGLVCIREKQRLAIGVDGDELDALDAGLNHTVDGVGSTAAHSDDFDDRQMLRADIVWHGVLHNLLRSCLLR